MDSSTQNNSRRIADAAQSPPTGKGASVDDAMATEEEVKHVLLDPLPAKYVNRGVGNDLATVVVVQHITILRHEVRIEDHHPTYVYTFECVDGHGCWCETFGDYEQLKWFLRGIRVSTSQIAATFSIEKVWQFTPQSWLKELP